MANDYKSYFLHKKTPFWYNVKSAKGKCKLALYLVLILQTSELDRNWSLFVIVNKK